MGITVAGRFFEYTQLLFGYSNSPHDFLRALWSRMRKIKNKVNSQILFYMDDILLLSRLTNEHKEDLVILFQELENDGWKINWDKCAFLKKEFEYLGVKLSTQGMKPAERMLRQFQEAEMPQIQKGWKTVYGSLAHLARFIY